MELKTDRNCHALYNLKYHVVMVTKYRKPCINEKLFTLIKTQFCKVAKMNGAEVEEIQYEPDHVHILLSAPPQACLSKIINSMKSTSARLLRKQFEEYLNTFYWKPYFWSRSYLILSSGGAPIEVIRSYIQEQNTEEHRQKKLRSKDRY